MWGSEDNCQDSVLSSTMQVLGNEPRCIDLTANAFTNRQAHWPMLSELFITVYFDIWTCNLCWNLRISLFCLTMCFWHQQDYSKPSPDFFLKNLKITISFIFELVYSLQHSHISLIAFFQIYALYLLIVITCVYYTYIYMCIHVYMYTFIHAQTHITKYNSSVFILPYVYF